MLNLHNKVIFRTLNYKWRLHFLKSGKPYITREFSKHGFNKWLGIK